VLFGLAFDAVTLQEAAAEVIGAAARHEKGLVVTPNVDHILLVADDPGVAAIYNRAAFRFADGMPIVWVAKLLGGVRRLPERVTGADLLVELCAQAAKSGVSIFLAGGRPGVADAAARRMVALHPGLRVVGTDSPPSGFERDPDQSRALAAKISGVRPGILFMGVGTPKQERWADRHLDVLDCGPIVCCGAAFDFAAGTAARAPVLVQRAGGEWLWRLLHEPRRLWRRYLLRGPRFLAFAARELAGHRRTRDN
jgi:N-acetylglucosaminyldiphosphoundecaprenol N-acetyl-beta-D-mannosaminyltransferase